MFPRDNNLVVSKKSTWSMTVFWVGNHPSSKLLSKRTSPFLWDRGAWSWYWPFSNRFVNLFLKTCCLGQGRHNLLVVNEVLIFQGSPLPILEPFLADLVAPTYRNRYAGFLKMDFPRIPWTSNPDLFRTLCALGEDLVSLHLLERDIAVSTTFPVPGKNKVESVRYDPEGKGRVWINGTQYFEGVSQEIWDFHIGGYQVCQKWLKDRKGRTLGYQDLLHYQKVVAVFSETASLQEKIDEAIGEWPISW